MNDIPYSRYLKELFALASAWLFFATMKCHFDDWTIIDVANWSQALSVFELIVAFVLALMSDQRILIQFKVERDEIKLRDDAARLGACTLFRNMLQPLVKISDVTIDGEHFAIATVEDTDRLRLAEPVLYQNLLNLPTATRLFVMENRALTIAQVENINAVHICDYLLASSLTTHGPVKYVSQGQHIPLVIDILHRDDAQRIRAEAIRGLREKCVRAMRLYNYGMGHSEIVINNNGNFIETVYGHFGEQNEVNFDGGLFSRQ